MEFHLTILVVLIGTALAPVIAEENLKSKTEYEIQSHVSDPINAVPENTLYTSIISVDLCGGILTSSVGTISYKEKSSISASERCMWIIKPGNVSEFTLSAIVSSLVIKPNHTGITATCFNRRGFTAFSSVAITQSGIVNLPPTCHSLVITFYSGSIVSSGGFRARYTGYAGAGGDLANSKYYLLNAAQEHVRHPANADLAVTKNELTMFGFGIPMNYYSARKTLVTYMGDTIGDSCAGMIHTYRFTPENGWASVKAFCSDVEIKQWEDNEIMLMTFTSGELVLGRGFHVVRTDLPLF